MFEITIGSRKMTPPRMLRIVPFGERYISLSPNSSTRASSGVIVAHLTPTPCSLIALRGVDRDLVVGRVAALDPEVEVLELDVEVGQDQLLLDERPDDPRHLVAVELDDRVLRLDLRHRAGDGIGAARTRHLEWAHRRRASPDRVRRSRRRRAHGPRREAQRARLADVRRPQRGDRRASRAIRTAGRGALRGGPELLRRARFPELRRRRRWRRRATDSPPSTAPRRTSPSGSRTGGASSRCR